MKKIGRMLGLLILVLSTAGMVAAQDSGGTFYPETQALENRVQLYPNPATEYLVVKFNVPRANSVKLTMHSVIGNDINIEHFPVSEYEVRLFVKSLPTGYYFLSIKDEKSDLKSTYKFLKY